MVIRILFFIFLSNSLFAQTNGIFRIYFTDKNNSPYSLSSPEDFLSQKSIDRRLRYSIPYDIKDLPVNPHYIDSVKQFINIYIHATSKWMNCIAVETDSTTLDSIMNLSVVSSADRLKSHEISSASEKLTVNNLRRFNSSSQNYYGAAYDQIHIHNGELLHNLNYRGAGMTIAVLDAGFPSVNTETAFQHLFSESRVAGTYNFVSDIPDVYTNTHVHGSLVLSCMASKIDYVHVGTSPEATYYFLLTENADSETPLEEDNWVEAAEFADSAGVDLINSSLGYTTYDDASLNYSYAAMNGNTTYVARGADIASSKGILVVASAGNNGTDSWFYIGSPGDADSVLTAGAVGTDRMYAGFSSKGPSSDGDIKPNIAAVGYATALIWPGNPNVSFGSGTSFSSPISCGMAACLWQAHPEKNNMEIIAAIQQSASQYSLPDSLMGYGIPDYYLAHQILSGQASQPEFLYGTVFPNPFSDELYLDLFSASEGSAEVEIYSATGQFIYATAETLVPGVKNRISLFRNSEKLSAGIYFIHIHSGNNTQVLNVNYLGY
jgi:serine protease AprX